MPSCGVCLAVCHTPVTYQVTYQVRPHLIHELEPDEAIGPSRRLVHEETHLVATKFVQIIIEDVDTRVVSSEISGNFRRNFSENFRKNNGTFPE